MTTFQFRCSVGDGLTAPSSGCPRHRPQTNQNFYQSEGRLYGTNQMETCTVPIGWTLEQYQSDGNLNGTNQMDICTATIGWTLSQRTWLTVLVVAGCSSSYEIFHKVLSYHRHAEQFKSSCCFHLSNLRCHGDLSRIRNNFNLKTFLHFSGLTKTQLPSLLPLTQYIEIDNCTRSEGLSFLELSYLHHL